MKPEDYQRRVLVCVTGLSPQVVTETVYALARQAEPWIPTEVHVLTTVVGAKQARLLLLASDRNQFRKLVRDYSIEGIRFDDAHIHVELPRFRGQFDVLVLWCVRAMNEPRSRGD